MENSPLVSRKSRRREREPPRRGYLDDHDKPAKSVADRHPTRTPLRYVPDLPGFEVLSKVEIKKDTREIEKNTTMLPPYESEVEGDENLLICSSKPPCPPESNVAKKRKRYIAWISGTDHIDQDLKKYRSALEQIKAEYTQILDDELRWNSTFLVMRRHLIAQMNLLQEESKKLRSEAKQLYSLSIEESGIQTRKRRAMHMRDVLSELQDRNLELIAHINDHKKAIADASGTAELQWLKKPFRYEIGLEAVGYSQGETVSTPYGKGTVESIRDCREQHAGIIVAVRLVFGVAYLQHQQVISANKLTVHPVPAPTDQVPMDISTQRLLGRFSTIEERLRLAESNIGDLENFFPDDEDEELDQELDSINIVPSKQEELAQAAPYLSRGFGCDEARWLRELEERAGKQQSRRKRRAVTAVECRTTILPRAPYNIPLLISPISQFPDKYLGALYGGQDIPEKTANCIHVPSQLSNSENIMLENQKLKANLARAKILLRRLENAKDDWQKQLEESDKTMVRTRAMFQALEVESEALAAQQRRDLAAWEISKNVPTQDSDNIATSTSRPELAGKGNRNVRPNVPRNRKSRGGRTSRGDGVPLSQESAENGVGDTDYEINTRGTDSAPQKAASLETEALAIGALASMGGAIDPEQENDDDEKRGQKRRAPRRRNPLKK